MGGEPVRLFFPTPLPPDPPVDLSSMQSLLVEASETLGRLDGLAGMLPDVSLLLYSYVRKEAVYSSQIEGTQSSLTDLIQFENAGTPGVPLEDVREVSSYVAALQHGIRRLREGFPLSLRLLCEVHAVLLAHGRDIEKQPGEFRRSQNWIGGTRPGNATYVPPPPEEDMHLMGQWERFLHANDPRIPTLVKAGLAHVQFETIHPFLDGNGRLGRLLIPLLLCAESVLGEPLLYLSLYLKQHRHQYYDLLLKVRHEGDWEAWMEFFLEGVRQSAGAAVVQARRILTRLAENEAVLKTQRRSTVPVQIHQYATTHPFCQIQDVAKALGVSFPTAAKAIQELVAAGLFVEVTGRSKDRLFAYQSYLDVLVEPPIR